MRPIFSLCLVILAGSAGAEEPVFPKFKVQEIATDLTVGYAVTVADINEDGKPDIVVVDSERVVWYENPTWKVHTIISKGKTKKDNVCIAVHDIDGDGHLDIVLGADWKPFNTKEGGTLQWLKRGKTLDEEWTVYPIAEEPTVHRVRMADIDGSGKPAIILAPLMGRDSTQKGNWMDGRPVRILAFPIPKDPVKGPWTPVVLSEELHVVHNIWPEPLLDGRSNIVIASYEGVSILFHGEGRWRSGHLGDGNQSNPKGNRGSSEIKLLSLPGLTRIPATIEPWHGNQVVVYPPAEPRREGQVKLDRMVIDDHLRWGHAVWCADLDGDKADELIIGVRDNPAKGDTFTEKCGVRIYKATDGVGKKWARNIIEDGGVAVEDLTVADLNGDGKPDIIAVGRGTHNARIYWNQGK
ncbi:MAG TPA: VCBS repeat-containing protein [Gemmataceae bacterium]|nr:VCBS repeat-containing protein [Gemmataceae bacterium]